MPKEQRRKPKYQTIADDLRERIDAGELAPGDRLPGENELATNYGVARMTAREALAALQAEGLTVTRKGAGAFVRDFRPIRRHSIERLSARRWGAGASIWEADTAGRSLVVDGIVVEEADPPAAVARALGEELTVVRRRRFVLDGKPVMLATSWLPRALVAGSAITEADTGPGGTYARLAELGAAPVHFVEELRARMPLAVESERLQLDAATPVVVIYRTAFTAQADAVEVTEMTLDASAYVIVYEFDDPTLRPARPSV